MSRPGSWGSADGCPARRWIRAAVAAVLVGVLSGCASRTLEIRSDPPGAEIVIDRHIVGTTPKAIPFTWGGEHEIILFPPVRAAGATVTYEPLVVFYDTTRFVHDTIGIDLIAALLPFTNDDHQMLDLTLRPSEVQPLLVADRTAYLQTVRDRVGTLRARARELQLGAAPLIGPDEPTSRPAPETRAGR